MTTDTLVLSPEALAALQAALTQQLASLVRRFTHGESTSVPVEAAESLLHSLLFTLGLTSRAKPVSPALLLNADLEACWAVGVAQLRREARTVDLLARAALETCPAVPNLALSDTLHSLQGFSQRYDPRFAAHELPASMDYQLALPVPDALQGVAYVHAWLRRLLAEHALLRRLDAARLLTALNDPEGTQRMALYAPIAANVTVLALLGLNPFDVLLSPDALPRLRDLLTPLSPAARQARLLEAAQAAARQLRLSSPESRAYLCDTILTLLPALNAALSSGDPAGLFALPGVRF